jgi:prepilin-type N-terminal cleavage/methylation domain-containing protein
LPVDENRSGALRRARAPAKSAAVPEQHSVAKTSSSRRLRRPAGFSLIELTLVVALLAVLAAIAIPRVSETLTRQRVEEAATRIVNDINLAQQQARLASATRRVIFDTAGDSYRLPEMADPDHLGTTYVTRLGAAPYEVSVASVSFGGDRTLIFNGYGQPDSGGTVEIAQGGYQAVVAVDAQTGRARIQTVRATPRLVATPATEAVQEAGGATAVAH